MNAAPAGPGRPEGRADLRVQVVAGPGVVARSGDAVLVAVETGSASALEELLASFRAACDGSREPGRLLARRLTRQLVDADPADVPSFAAIAPAPDGWVVFLHGAVDADVTAGSQQQRLSGREAATWVDRIVAGPLLQARLGAGPDGGSVADEHLDLRAGTVPGAGAVLRTSAQPSQAATPAGNEAERTARADRSPPSTDTPPPGEELPPPEAPPLSELRPPPAEAPAGGPAVPAGEADGEAFEAVPLFDAAGAEERAPLPVASADADQEAPAPPAAGEVEVDGILCERGHFNHPDALYCSQCGVSTVHRTRTKVRGPRPSLGVVVLDDGTTFTLDSGYVLGREPERDPDVAQGKLRPLRLPDPDRSISRVHAVLRLEDWDVLLVDQTSANGTFVALRGDLGWTRLQPQRPQPLVPGTRIAVGKRVLTFDTHHQVGA